MTERARLFTQDDLSEDAVVELTANQAHYLRNVMRFQSGGTVALFNGRDGEWRGRIDSLGKNRGAVKVETRLRRQNAEPDLWLLFAPLKRARLDMVVQKAVELGVSRLQPIITERTNMARINRDRLTANAIEAAEQCERLTIPEVHPSAPLFDALEDWPEGRRLWVCAETGASTPIGSAFRAVEPGDEGAILVGPEGGFVNNELDVLNKLPFVTTVGLGPRILRAETAAIAALACYQAVLGDWRLPPRADLDHSFL
ncbi:MAG: 16S rRNA (uracil(1498)-N(3))-methyltransferase [Rhodospirillaceae bacterium]|nr:16S rRNA (uracil(1498)-N(3))-methyltransferase [Rhodospirillaceae bacterium]